MKRFLFIIPIMIVVAVIAMWMLEKDYSEIELNTRLIIAVSAAVLSGVTSFFLLGSNGNENKIDSLPPRKK